MLSADVSPEAAAALLRDGKRLRVTDTYARAAQILDALTVLMGGEPPPHAPFAHQRTWKRSWARTAGKLMFPVEHGRLALSDARHIGFLKELYPDAAFCLSAPDVQLLYGAWQRHQQGVHLAVLGGELHPYYGTYAPTRTEHLELFATWLAGYDGSTAHAADVGTGSGVLALMLAKRFDRVHAIDDNPNAVESVRREVARRDPPPPIEPVTADLLGPAKDVDLVVFNPPWTPGPVDDLLDRALHYDDVAVFERFFAQAHAALAPGGRVVVLFSNIATLLTPEAPHPLEAELARGRFTLAAKQQRKVKPSKGHRRTREKVELWEFSPV